MSRSAPRLAGKWFAFATVLIDAIGIGLIFPIMPDLLAELGHFSVAGAALWGGILTSVYAVMQFLFSPIIGNLSDHYGRRPVLLLSLLAMVIDYLILGFAGTLWLLFVGRVIAGIAGATYSTATAYLADVSTPAERAQNFGLVGAAFGIGFVLGPALGGLLGELHLRAPFFLAAGLAAANVAFGVLVLPESLPPQRRRRFSFTRANPFAALRLAFTNPALRGLLACFFVHETAIFVYPSIWPYFGKESFGWTTGVIGLSLAGYGLCAALVSGLLIRPCVRVLGEGRVILFGLVINIFGLVAIAFAPASIVVFALIPFIALGDMVGPAMRGVLSNKVPDDAQGELQGVLASLAALQSIIAPLIMTGTFGLFADSASPPYFPGAPFLLAALMVLAIFYPISQALRRG